MKIALINNLYYPYQRGGAERITERLAASLRKGGHEVFFIATCPIKGRKEADERSDVRYLPSLYYDLASLPSWRRAFWQAANIFDRRQAEKLSCILSEEKPELVISGNLMGLGWLAPKAVSEAGIRHIHILHDIQLIHPSGLMFWGKERIIDSWPARIYQMLTKLQFKGIAGMKVVSPSRWLLDLHKEKGFFRDNDSYVIPNPLPDAPAISHSSPGKTRFVFLGQLEKHKGIDLFLEAAKRFEKRDIEWIVIGNGSLRTGIEKEKVVTYLGSLANSEVMAELSKASALIMPSRCYENAPNVIAEAALAGTPCLAAAIGGIPEMILRFGGRTFAPDDLDGMCGVIDAFLYDKDNVKVSIPEFSDYGKALLGIL